MIQVLIVEDHSIVRRGIKALLSETDDIQVVGEACNGLEAIRLSKELEPDVILMDLLIPVMDGIEATRQITARQPDVRVLAMISFIGDETIIPAIRAGARGYVMQGSAASELVRSIYKVHGGEPAFRPGSARKMVEEISELLLTPEMTIPPVCIFAEHPAEDLR